jgi:regulator of sirC expression with transglutaminase-like and TPR domain
VERSARARFTALVSVAEPELELAAAALEIAAEEYPQLRPEPYLYRLDLLAANVRDRLANETAPPVLLQELSRVLFEEEGFRGNADNYYDPRNSFLNDVLDRKLGIPLTLSIVYLEVGWRLGLPLSGVNFPGHFLVRYEGEALRLLVDPFQRGLVLFEDQAQALLDRVYGGAVTMQLEFLRPAGRRDILTRLLANLKGIYQQARDDDRTLAAIDRILVLEPDNLAERRDRGMVLARLGRHEEALADLQAYLSSNEHASDAPRVQMLLTELRRLG